MHPPYCTRVPGTVRPCSWHALLTGTASNTAVLVSAHADMAASVALAALAAPESALSLQPTTEQ
jgi:hypothetical protein